ncbi:RNI-like protein [Annulohypoxylon truncatum]|uniref:RNI-like protein n=1 Tax=Annulohypoxylon truncatum TaxID=327061 RepID=UPI00200799D3|nr:RNI-like protein [Annulohypoxylon truncatum]KAI1205650.1 RNI-like protein [Annulohypoxylon truncatum]
MRRNRVPHSPPSPYRALAHHPANGQPPDSASLIRSFNSETNPTRPIRPSPLTASTIPDMPLDLLDRMRSFPLFMSAPEEFLVAIGRHLRPQVHAAHDHILTEGDEARAMYWLVRGVVGVTSRDGEAVYAELKPGAFFGEIGVLMDMPRTATIIARTKCLLLVLKKEDLHLELPKFPDMEKAIREEAHERLTILNKKRQENGRSVKGAKGSVTTRDAAPGKVFTGEVGVIKEGAVKNTKKRKSPSPGALEDAAAGSALGSGLVNVRQTLKELPLFSTLPPDILHFLGMSAQPKTYSPFTDIIKQGSAGNEIYFIVRGEAEVIHEVPGGKQEKRITRSSLIRPRLRQGQYFGEVASLGLSVRRTATVRSITAVECLMISGEALEELWKRCPPDIRKQVEDTAKTRIGQKDEDVEMKDAEPTTNHVASPSTPTGAGPTPKVTFTTPSKPASPVKDEADQMEPKDPDPYLSVDMENLRNRRRGSLAPPTPQPPESSGTPMTNGLRLRVIDTSTTARFPVVSVSPDSEVPAKKAKILPNRPHPSQEPLLPDDILVTIFQFLDLAELIRMRQLSSHMRKLLAESPKLCTDVDLTPYNRFITDEALINVIAPFLGPRPVSIDISNCFHITDEGFSALWKMCGKNIKIWRMKSVWDVSANQILDMSDNAKGLEEVDWSNCRKVGDNLLARVVGWVVPEHPPPNAKQMIISNSAARLRAQQQQHQHQQGQQQGQQSQQGQQGQHQQQQSPQKPPPQTIILPPPGTVIGCPKLKRLNLSYCKHITDRSMAHMAAHASSRLESLSLTRCTSITDAGFQSWAPFRFTNLSRLCLADCTYLSDNAIVALVHAAKSLTHLDLSFCCALSDTATEVVALGLPRLKELKMAFCGSAVSDNSLACVALHLNDLERLSVRGCVRVTAAGIESVLEGCAGLRWADVSQCRNLEGWVRAGGVARWGFDERGGGGGSSGGGGSGSSVSADSPVEVESSSPTRMEALSPGRTSVLSPRSNSSRSVDRHGRPAVAFVVEKGAGGLR